MAADFELLTRSPSSTCFFENVDLSKFSFVLARFRSTGGFVFGGF